VVGLDLP